MLLNIFVETVLDYIFWIFGEWNESSNAQHICNIVNVFTVTFDQFNASLLDKSNNNKKKYSLSQKFSAGNDRGKRCDD